MSCHDIGRGMNSVVKVVIELFDSGKMELEATREIIAACRKGVNWCDGNEYEAIACIRRCRCGKCLRKVPKDEYLFSVWDVSREVPNRYRILDGGEIKIASDGLCESCFDEVMNAHCQDVDAGQRERKYIMSTEPQENYLSEGEMSI